MKSGVFEHVGRLEFDDFFPKDISVDRSSFHCYLLQGNMNDMLKRIIKTRSDYISDDIGSNSILTEVFFESMIRSLKIGTGCYNSVVALNLSVYSELESVEIGDFSFRNCVRFECSGLKNLQQLVIGDGCFSREEWYDSEYDDEYEDEDEESGYDDENENDYENGYEYDDSEEYGIDFDDVELLNDQYETDEDHSASDAVLLNPHDYFENQNHTNEYTGDGDEDEYIDSDEDESIDSDEHTDDEYSSDEYDEYDSDEYDDDLLDSDDKITALHYERSRMDKEHSLFILTNCSKLSTLIIGLQSFTGFEKCVIQS